MNPAKFSNLHETESGVVNQPGGGCVWHQWGGHVSNSNNKGRPFRSGLNMLSRTLGEVAGVGKLQSAMVLALLGRTRHSKVGEQQMQLEGR